MPDPVWDQAYFLLFRTERANRSSADFLISSPLFEDDGYVPVVKDYKAYVERVLK